MLLVFFDYVFANDKNPKWSGDGCRNCGYTPRCQWVCNVDRALHKRCSHVDNYEADKQHKPIFWFHFSSSHVILLHGYAGVYQSPYSMKPLAAPELVEYAEANTTASMPYSPTIPYAVGMLVVTAPIATLPGS